LKVTQWTPKAIALTKLPHMWGRLACSRRTDSSASCGRPAKVVASGVGWSAEDSPDLADDIVGHATVRVVCDARSDIIELSDYAYQRTMSRLAGLTDDEYFWEPVPGCCTIRRTESGDYPADDADRPGNPPFTTIAWRLWHLIENYGGKRNPEWLGVERPPDGFERDDPAPATAAEAIAVLAVRRISGGTCSRNCPQLPGGNRWAPSLANTPRVTRPRSCSTISTNRSTTGPNSVSCVTCTCMTVPSQPALLITTDCMVTAVLQLTGS